MALVQCVHCKQKREGLAIAPMPTAIGEKIKTSICEACWKEWMTMSTKVINEYRLQLFRPEHRETLEKQMRLFLGV